MTSSIFTDIQINNAQQFVDSISRSTSNTKIYLTFGKTDAWSNEAAPLASNTSGGSLFEVWSNMIGGKRVLGGDVHHVIPRNNWTANTVYFAYDHKTPNLHNNDFYIVNSDYDVYKCISNNTGAVSTSQPTSINTTTTTLTADGYVWKYMYSISDSEQLRFTTTDFIPVKTLMADDGSQQWQVQNNAVNGSIENILINTPGTLYTNSSTISITISGDGSSATATATRNAISNTVSSITITDSGSGYTYSNVTISDTGTGTGATASAIISPVGGHGSDPLYELGGKNVLINTKLKYDEDAVLPVTNDFRQISLIKNPKVYNSANTITNIAFLQALTIICDGSGDFTEDELVYQGTSLETSTFSGRVVSWNSTTSKLLLINTRGTAALSQSIIGNSSFTTRVITSTENSACQPNSGKLLYLNNILVVTRAADQIEDFRIVLSY